ncbi:hypothetical protein B0H14DRAFT_2694306 [Mycena olivaceomarginata]|nr:hypothetical protein B0H14DRAFT_2694306 [Mycena olivaceomarginata]
MSLGHLDDRSHLIAQATQANIGAAGCNLAAAIPSVRFLVLAYFRSRYLFVSTPRTSLILQVQPMPASTPICLAWSSWMSLCHLAAAVPSVRSLVLVCWRGRYLFMSAPHLASIAF